MSDDLYNQLLTNEYYTTYAETMTLETYKRIMNDLRPVCQSYYKSRLNRNLARTQFRRNVRAYYRSLVLTPKMEFDDLIFMVNFHQEISLRLSCVATATIESAFKKFYTADDFQEVLAACMEL